MSEGELNQAAREFVGKCMSSRDRLEKTGQVVEAIKAFCSLAPDATEEARSVIAGDSQAKRKFIVDVVKAYRSEKPGNTLTEFFNERYRDRALVLLKPTDAIREAIRSQPAEKPVGKPEAVKVEEPAVEKPVPVKRAATPMKVEDRVELLAALLSDEQNAPLESVKKTEMDVIKRVMSITDVNRETGITDEDVLGAALSMVADKNTEHKFIMEALGEVHREELLKRAVKT